MARQVMVVLSNPTPGKEDEYNDWYTNTHLGDVLKIPGIIGAQRFRYVTANPDDPANPGHKYLAIYELDTDNLPETHRQLLAAAGTEAMSISDALDSAGSFNAYFEAICDPVKSL